MITRRTPAAARQYRTIKLFTADTFGRKTATAEFAAADQDIGTVGAMQDVTRFVVVWRGPNVPWQTGQTLSPAVFRGTGRSKCKGLSGGVRPARPVRPRVCRRLCLS